MIASGISTKEFEFIGFLSANNKERKDKLEEIKFDTRTLIFYEAPHKLPTTLKDMAEYFGDRKIALVKELTKIHENVEHTTLFAASEKYNEIAPKGEFVVIVEGKSEEEEEEITLEMATSMAKELIKNGTSINEASKEIAKKTGLKKSDIYKSLQSE